MELDADLRKRLNAVRPPSVTDSTVLFLRRFALNLVGVGLIATLICSLTTGLTMWVSTLPVISPVSLSLCFNTWPEIVAFNAHVWSVVFGIGAPIALMVTFRPQVDQTGHTAT